jgi:hypothetical protein
MKQAILITDTLSGFGLTEDQNPKFNHLVGKGVSLFFTIQHFAYKTFEKSIIKI